ncbi:MAG TPA: lytic transglycosylase domain-containing protein [Streptosporangiaceae bacterium]|nr:lytic transglycosylase domain-containing protein [Streptosporangiaceae bacterium]
MLIRLRYAVVGAVIVAVGAGVPAAIVTGAVKLGYVQVSRSGAKAAPLAEGGTNGVKATPVGSSVVMPPGRLIVPDLVAVRAAGLSAAQVSAIGGLAGVRAVLVVDGGRVTIGGQPASVLGVPPQAFRSWTPPVTAADAGIWAGLATGQIVADQAAAGRLGLAADVAVLINAPGADLAALMRQVQGILGPGGTVRNLVLVATAAPPRLPVDESVPSGRPSNWLDLYRESAAEYCPGLSWTVLAAIGEIESGDGANEGPSSAGALGPMQFMPSTWQVWGTDGFGDTGPPDIMNPFDAVPSGRPDAVRRGPRPAAGPRWRRPSSVTTTRTGTSARCSPWRLSTRRSTRERLG